MSEPEDAPMFKVLGLFVMSGESPSQVLECSRCAALVVSSGMDKHEQWHFQPPKTRW